MNVIRSLVGFALVGFAFWPGLTAIRIFAGVILPSFKTGPNLHVHNTVIIAGFPLTGWQVCAATAGMGFVAVLLICGGSFLAFAMSPESKNTAPN
jgi:hypothetical protein